MKINFTDTLSVTFHASNNLVNDQLKKEFSLLRRDCNSKTNLDIYFVESKRRFKKISSFYKKFKSSGRYYLLSCENNAFYVYLSRYASFIDFFYCLFNPYRQKRIVLSLIDFLHNVFLGILETKLLNENATIFHSCGFVHHDRLTVIASSAQSGKTTAVMHLKKHFKVVAEDYCIVKNKTFYLLTIIKQSQNYQPHSFFEKLNKVISKMERKQQIEFETFSQAFGVDKIGSHVINKMLFLSRCSDSNVGTGRVFDIMKNEIDNYVGFKEWMNISCKEFDYGSLLSKLNLVLENVCKVNDISLLCIPFKDDLNDYLEELCRKLADV